MYKKKEIIIIISIVLFTLLLAFLPTFINNHKRKNNVIENVQSTINDNNIVIRIEGEIFYKSGNNYYSYCELAFPKGITYGYIIQKINVYLTNYRKIDFNLFSKQYNESTTIIIDTYDINYEIEEEIIYDDKLNINQASKTELMKLYGIGDKRSDTIIEYRTNKRIESFEELQKLIGVSDEVIERIKEKAICQ